MTATNIPRKPDDLSRRGMLMKLGLGVAAATVAYSAPVMLQLGEAKASSFSGRRRPRRPGRPRRSFSH